MESSAFLLKIALVLLAAVVAGVLFERLRQSAILGYLIAGTLLGPTALNLVDNGDSVATVAELGVALLLFSIGLEFSLQRLRAMGAIALGGGSAQLLFTGLLFAGAGMLAGMPMATAVAFGLMIGPSSTACVLRLLQDRSETDSLHGRASIGILLLQDIAVVPLVLLVSILGGQGGLGEVAAGLGKSLGAILLLGGLLYGICSLLLPVLLGSRIATQNREVPLLVAVLTCLGATTVAHMLHLSPALGAFIAGLMLAESPFATQLRADVGPLRIIFVTIFFVSIGLLADVPWALANLPLIGLVTVGILLGKSLVTLAVMRAFGLPMRHSVMAALSLAQVGEFAFILAGLALKVEAITPDHFRLIVSATIVSLLLTPLLIGIAPALGAWAETTMEKWGLLKPAPRITEESKLHLSGHVIVVGFGPTSHAMQRTLAERQVPHVVVELNPKTVANIRTMGIHAEVGDATKAEVLEHLSVHEAMLLVVTVPDHRTVLEVINMARRMAPDMPIVARSRYHRFSDELREAGANVVDEEEQIGRLLGQATERWLNRGTGTWRFASMMKTEF